MEDHRWQVAFRATASLGETPLWDPQENLLYWVDITGRVLHRFDPATGNDTSAEMPDLVGAVALGARGIVLCLRNRVAVCSSSGDQLSQWPEVFSGERERFNDARVDPHGRLWAGSMDIAERQPLGGLYVISGPDDIVRVAGDMVVSNGLDFTSDGAQLFHIDSYDRGIDHWWIREEPLGIIVRQRLFEIPARHGEPDGMVLDAEGTIWVALWGGGCIRRYDTGGRLLEHIAVPVSQPTGLTFGGPELRHLYFASAREGLSPAALEKEPLAGSLFYLETTTPGRPAQRAVFG